MRAARVLWAKIIKGFNPKNPKSMALRHPLANVRLEPGGTRCVQQCHPHLCEALAAVLGHTQSLHTNALDEAIALPTDFSARIARNTDLLQKRPVSPKRWIRGRQLLCGIPHPRVDDQGMASYPGN